MSRRGVLFLLLFKWNLCIEGVDGYIEWEICW